MYSMPDHRRRIFNYDSYEVTLFLQICDLFLRRFPLNPIHSSQKAESTKTIPTNKERTC